MGLHYSSMRVRYFIGALKITLTENCHGSGWPKFPKNNFRGKFLVPFYDWSCLSQKLNLQLEGPFVANTSHPILLIGNTAGVYN